MATSSEAASLGAGQARIKYRTEFQPLADDDDDGAAVDSSVWKPLAQALELSEALGAAPVLPDSKVGGNGAVILSEGILVSRSGRSAGESYTASDFVRVLQFDAAQWKAVYSGVNATIKPSSDTPLLWHALKVAPIQFGWTKRPRFVLHGHSCATAEEAAERHIPCSHDETLFSTPQDLDALMELLQQYPYPDNQIYVRKNHGFFLLAQNADEACRIFCSRLIPKKSEQL